MALGYSSNTLISGLLVTFVNGVTSSPGPHCSLQRSQPEEMSSFISTVPRYRVHIRPSNAHFLPSLLQVRPKIGVSSYVLLFFQRSNALSTVFVVPRQAIDLIGVSPPSINIYKASHSIPLMHSAFCRREHSSASSRLCTNLGIHHLQHRTDTSSTVSATTIYQAPA